MLDPCQPPGPAGGTAGRTEIPLPHRCYRNAGILVVGILGSGLAGCPMDSGSPRE